LRRFWVPGGDDFTQLVESVAFSPDGQVVAVGTGFADARPTIQLWRVADGVIVNYIKADMGEAVLSAAYSRDGAILASGSADELVRLWLVSDGELLRTMEGHTNDVKSVAFSPDGEMLASGSTDGTVRLWSVADGTPLITLEGHVSDVTAVAFSPDGALVASASLDGTVRLWGLPDE
jgi:WD40 repeat protein